MLFSHFFAIALTALLVSSAAFAGCSHINTDCLEGSGEIVNSTLNIGNFTGIKTVGLMKVYITQGDVVSLRIKADDNIVSRLEPRVVDGNLTFNDAICYSPSRPVEVYVTMKHIQHISLNGAGEIIGQSAIISPKLLLNVNGTGDIRLQIETENLETNINGSGSVTLKGTAVNVGVNIKGSGNIYSYGLHSVNSNIVVAGSGSIETTVMNILDATILGSGDIFYKGSPETIKQTIAGSGTLKKRS
ncbi:head GIN domain-containing protein [Ignavibacteria bacterium]|nr:DUF2807 domain-containing protein [Bacteroidota bacterium]MCZ2132484.1 DUF2807 domain-containing protein [Bacteroidota bacterium]